MSMSNIKIGNVVDGQITGITKYGIFVSLEDNYVGLVHISEISNKFVSDIENKFKIGSLVKVKILEINENKLQVKLSIKQIPKCKKRKGIEEKGRGFTPLEEKMPEWIEFKLEELDKKVDKN